MNSVKYIVTEVEDLSKIASRQGGYIYGRFLHDVLVPSYQNNFHLVQESALESVTFLFSSQDDMEKFRAPRKLVKDSDSYMLVDRFGDNIIRVHTYVKKHYPLSEASTFAFRWDATRHKVVSTGTESLTTFTKNCTQKHLNISDKLHYLLTYDTIIGEFGMNPNEIEVMRNTQKTFVDTYLSQGWTVSTKTSTLLFTYEDGVISTDIPHTFDTKQELELLPTLEIGDCNPIKSAKKKPTKKTPVKKVESSYSSDDEDEIVPKKAPSKRKCSSSSSEEEDEVKPKKKYTWKRKPSEESYDESSEESE